MVVIGAGLSGAGAAYSLAQRGVPTLLLDARGVSGGASGRNGGFLGGATWLQMPVLLLKMPWQHAVQTVSLKSANLMFIRELLSLFPHFSQFLHLSLICLSFVSHFSARRASTPRSATSSTQM